MPTESFPVKSIDSVSYKPRESSEIIQQKKIENPIPDVPYQKCYKSFEDFNKKICNLKLNSYAVEKYPTYTKIFKFDDVHSIPFIEIYVQNSLEFHIRVYLWKLPKNHEIYTKSLWDITLTTLTSTIENSFICPGIISSYCNYNNAISHVVPKNYDPLEVQEFALNQDVYYRSKFCILLCNSTTMCKFCDKSKSKLVKADNRKKLSDSLPAKDKAPLSRTSTERIRKKIGSLNLLKTELILENNNLKEQITALQNELNSSSLTVSNELDNDLKSIFSKANDKNVSPFMKLFWSEQQKYLSKSSTRGIRYHPTLIRYCLSLAAKSPAAYDQIRYDEKNSNGFLILPSRRRLRDYKNYITPQRGFNKEVIKELIKKIEHFSELEKFMIILMDEMKIQENLVWNKHTGELIGYIDLGDADINYATLQNSEKLASHVLVFLLASLVNPFKFTLANFGTDTATSEQLFPLFWKAVSLCEIRCKIKIMGVTCDGATQNRKFFKMHHLMTWEEDLNSDVDVTYRIRNPFADDDRYIYFISDPPHLLKTLRNCLKSSAHGQTTRYMWNDGFHILWNHISDLFYEDLECGLHLLPKLTVDHINLTSYAKMNVRLAAQVLSSTVSNVLKDFAPSYTAGTAKFCEMVDNFFDCLNVPVPNTVKLLEDGLTVNKKRKPFVEPYSDLHDFRFNWLINDFLKYFKEWHHSIETRSGNFTKVQQAKMFISRQTYEGLKITVHSSVELTQFLLKHDVPYVLTGKFIQDALENYFSIQRAIGRRKENPSLYDVGYNDNAIRNSKIFKPIDGTNCENKVDDTLIIDKLPSKKVKR